MKTFRYLFPLAFALILSACYSLAEDITPPPDYSYNTPVPTAVPTEVMYFPLMPPDPESGAEIYVEKCEPCHGAAGYGDGPKAADLPNPVAPIGDPELSRQRTPEDWFRQVTNGNIDRYMPPFTSLTERQRWDVVAYAFSLSSQPERAAAGEQLYLENCTECHGVTGSGDGPVAANLPDKPAAFTDQAFMAEQSLNDLIAGLYHPTIPDFPPYEEQLTEASELALAEFLRSISFKPEAVVASEPEIPGAVSGGSSNPVSPETDTTADLEAGHSAANISGQVINVSGGEVPAGLEITLYGFDQFQQTLTQTKTLQLDGTYDFGQVSMPPGRAFLTAVDYDGATYTSEMALVGAAPEDISLPLSVFESSSDTSTLTIDRLHVFFEFLSADTVRVAELVLVTNPTDRVIRAAESGEPTLVIPLPPNAQNLQFEDDALGSQFVLLDQGVGDLRGIQPGIGTHQILFSFDMPYDSRFDLNQALELPVEALVVMIPEMGVKLVDDTLVSDGVRDVEGLSYELFVGGNLPAGTELPIKLSGKPDFGDNSGGFSLGSSLDLATGAIVLGASLTIVGTWWYRVQQKRNDAIVEVDEEEPIPEHVAGMESDELIDAIIALDDRYTIGDLPEGAYLKQRSLLKQRLSEILED